MHTSPKSEDYVERDDESLGFWGALVMNGALSAFRAGLVEAVFATDQIPRFPYADPFRSAMNRRRERQDDE